MDSDQIIALVGAVILAVIVRVSNMVLKWLSRVLGVDEPDPIGSNVHVGIDQGGTSPLPSEPTDETRPP